MEDISVPRQKITFQLNKEKNIYIYRERENHMTCNVFCGKNAINSEI